MQHSTGRKKIIDTLSYPGLAVKGIAAVGPTLDVYGQIDRLITLHGELNAGAQVSFGKAEVFWPQDEDSKNKYETLVGIESDTQTPAPFNVGPVFHAGVEVDAQLNVIVTPEANVGIKIGGSKLTGGSTLMNAQLTGYLKGILSFQAQGDYETDSNAFNYRLGVYFIYNIGYKATAQLLNFIDWALSPREAYNPDKTIKIYEKTGSISMSAEDEKRSLSDEQNATNAISSRSNSLSLSNTLVRRADDTQGPLDPKVKDPLSCPPSSSGDIRVPELRCLCTPILGLPENKRQTRFTWSPGTRNNSLPKKRRKIQCPGGFCEQATKNLNNAVGRTELMREFQSNWAKLEPERKADDQRGDYWVPWSTNSRKTTSKHILGRLTEHNGVLAWTTPGSQGKQGYVQRLKEYPTKQPLPEGIESEQRNNNKESWVFKRDYDATWIQKDPVEASDWWSATSFRYQDSTYGSVGGAKGVICAINHFAQDEVYRLPGYTNNKPWNGYCWTDRQHPATTYSNKGTYNWCLVEYAAVDGDGDGDTNMSNTKRDWEVKRVTILDEVDGNFLDTGEDHDSPATVQLGPMKQSISLGPGSNRIGLSSSTTEPGRDPTEYLRRLAITDSVLLNRLYHATTLRDGGASLESPELTAFLTKLFKSGFGAIRATRIARPIRDPTVR
ncbi:Major Facilitator Superfamily protein [Aspergillus affinis]|uniref:Major Facilitator Superfamily protein n=1 Tax=Aspergillus affinis TaxID=1070780 RepID=UPI0022FE12B9|nr:Major Facilitator Superfamily protein [Aspergillus affinis]KAI9045865.1 Major Facilitator Superfamily protein [Aspergillus affinis]